MSEITVVIPNYNGMKYLPECMASLCQGQENALARLPDALEEVGRNHLHAD